MERSKARQAQANYFAEKSEANETAKVKAVEAEKVVETQEPGPKEEEEEREVRNRGAVLGRGA